MTVRRLHNGLAGKPQPKKPKPVTLEVRGVLRYALALIERAWQPSSFPFARYNSETVNDGRTIKAAWSIETAIGCEGSHHKFDAWDAVHSVVGRYSEWEWEHGGEQAAALLRAIINDDMAAIDAFRATRIEWLDPDRVRHVEQAHSPEPMEPIEYLLVPLDYPRRPERYELDMLFHTAPEPHEDEVEAAIRASRMESGSFGTWQVPWDELPVFMRLQLRAEMRAALMAAARVRAAQADRAKYRSDGEEAALFDLFRTGIEPGARPPSLVTPQAQP